MTHTHPLSAHIPYYGEDLPVPFKEKGVKE
jgi:hypothetical protein